MKASKKEFIAETEDILFGCQQLLLEIQDTYQASLNPDTINALFRSIHTLKGLSGLFGNHEITDLSHALESLLDDIRLGKINITEDVVNFLFKNLDILNSAVDGVKEDKEYDLKEHINNIKTFRESWKEGNIGPDIKGIIDDSILKVLSEYEEHRLKANIKNGKGIYLLKAIFELSTFDTSLEDLTKKIKSEGELISTLPVSAHVPEGSIGFNLMFASNKQLKELQKEIADNIEVLVRSKQAVTEPDKKPGQSIKSQAATVRVDIDKLDRILNTIGELTLAKDAVRRIGIEVAEVHTHSPFVRDIHKISQSLERKLSELQKEVLSIRMVPIGQIFSRLAQVIRRYSREMGKEIVITLYGEDTELDKSLAEEIVDPLMHLVRNSIDHGIEPVKERLAKGKKEQGCIILKAFQRGNYIVIEVTDDGRGIDIDSVMKKAIEKGMIDPSAGVEGELINFIFAPGFSTKDVASEISGRGVGLDVVKEKLSSLGGFTDIHTKKDEGTTFTLTLPITLAIIKALLVKVGNEKFGLPLTAISETVAVEHKDIQTIEWKDVYYIRGEMLPIISLAKIFGIESARNDVSFAVVVGFGKRKLGLLVDEILEQQEIVIKSLGEYFKGLSGFAGAAEIGRHEVILVLDIESIIEKSLIRQENYS
ncbi:MAG: chemotaxis protein CheA [Nitrospirae bacterium]|nr:chemotaxis protein CheA [Nitrospirota bacterium]